MRVRVDQAERATTTSAMKRVKVIDLDANNGEESEVLLLLSSEEDPVPGRATSLPEGQVPFVVVAAIEEVE